MKGSKKRQLLVFFDFINHFGGAQRSTVLLCEYLKPFSDVEVIDAYGKCDEYLGTLSKKGINVNVLSVDAKDTYVGHERERLKRFVRFAKQIPSLLILRRRLINRISQINPDLIWTNSSKALFFLTANMRLRKFALAFYARGWYRFDQVSWLSRYLIKRRVDSVLAVSNPTKQSLVGWGVPSRKIHVTFTTIDYSDILEDASKEPIVPLPGINREFKILVPAVLVKNKGQDTAIKAAGILRKRGLDVVMWLAGDLPCGGQSEYFASLKDLIEKNKLEQDVFLLGWRKDIRSLMRVSDVVVLATHTEGLPRTVQEAMVLRRPVISTPVGGVTDLIIDRKTGILSPVRDEKKLADNIELIVSDNEIAIRISENAYKHIFENFSTTKQIGLVREAFLSGD